MAETATNDKTNGQASALCLDMRDDFVAAKNETKNRPGGPSKPVGKE